VFLVLATACLVKTRLNPHCKWVGDTSALAIDMRDAAQHQHLAMDVRVAPVASRVASSIGGRRRASDGRCGYT